MDNIMKKLEKDMWKNKWNLRKKCMCRIKL